MRCVLDLQVACRVYCVCVLTHYISACCYLLSLSLLSLRLDRQPCAFVQIRSIGKIDTERNPKTAQALTAAVTELLGVPADRVFMNLDDIAATNWGAQGTTVDKLNI